jgi:hypothetical protein
MHRDRTNLKMLALSVAAIAGVIASITRPDLLAVGGAGALLFLLLRLVARTLHAFIQGINEGDDPRQQKLPPDDP